MVHALAHFNVITGGELLFYRQKTFARGAEMLSTRPSTLRLTLKGRFSEVKIFRHNIVFDLGQHPSSSA